MQVREGASVAALGKGEISAIAMGGKGDCAFVGTSRGFLLRISVQKGRDAEWRDLDVEVERPVGSDGRPISCIKVCHDTFVAVLSASDLYLYRQSDLHPLKLFSKPLLKNLASFCFNERSGPSRLCVETPKRRLDFFRLNCIPRGSGTCPHAEKYHTERLSESLIGMLWVGNTMILAQKNSLVSVYIAPSVGPAKPSPPPVKLVELVPLVRVSLLLDASGDVLLAHHKSLRRFPLHLPPHANTHQPPAPSHSSPPVVPSSSPMPAVGTKALRLEEEGVSSGGACIINHPESAVCRVLLLNTQKHTLSVEPSPGESFQGTPHIPPVEIPDCQFISSSSGGGTALVATSASKLYFVSLAPADESKSAQNCDSQSQTLGDCGISPAWKLERGDGMIDDIERFRKALEEEETILAKCVAKVAAQGEVEEEEQVAILVGEQQQQREEEEEVVTARVALFGAHLPPRSDPPGFLPSNAQSANRYLVQAAAFSNRERGAEMRVSVSFVGRQGERWCRDVGMGEGVVSIPPVAWKEGCVAVVTVKRHAHGDSNNHRISLGGIGGLAGIKSECDKPVGVQGAQRQADQREGVCAWTVFRLCNNRGGVEILSEMVEGCAWTVPVGWKGSLSELTDCWEGEKGESKGCERSEVVIRLRFKPAPESCDHWRRAGDEGGGGTVLLVSPGACMLGRWWDKRSKGRLLLKVVVAWEGEDGDGDNGSGVCADQCVIVPRDEQGRDPAVLYSRGSLLHEDACISPPLVNGMTRFFEQVSITLPQHPPKLAHLILSVADLDRQPKRKTPLSLSSCLIGKHQRNEAEVQYLGRVRVPLTLEHPVTRTWAIEPDVVATIQGEVKGEAMGTISMRMEVDGGLGGHSWDPYISGFARCKDVASGRAVKMACRTELWQHSRPMLEGLVSLVRTEGCDGVDVVRCLMDAWRGMRRGCDARGESIVVLRERVREAVGECGAEEMRQLVEGVRQVVEEHQGWVEDADMLFEVLGAACRYHGGQSGHGEHRQHGNRRDEADLDVLVTKTVMAIVDGHGGKSGAIHELTRWLMVVWCRDGLKRNRDGQSVAVLRAMEAVRLYLQRQRDALADDNRLEMLRALGSNPKEWYALNNVLRGGIGGTKHALAEELIVFVDKEWQQGKEGRGVELLCHVLLGCDQGGKGERDCASLMYAGLVKMLLGRFERHEAEVGWERLAACFLFVAGGMMGGWRKRVGTGVWNALELGVGGEQRVLVAMSVCLGVLESHCVRLEEETEQRLAAVWGGGGQKAEAAPDRDWRRETVRAWLGAAQEAEAGNGKGMLMEGVVARSGRGAGGQLKGAAKSSVEAGIGRLSVYVVRGLRCYGHTCIEAMEAGKPCVLLPRGKPWFKLWFLRMRAFATKRKAGRARACAASGARECLEAAEGSLACRNSAEEWGGIVKLLSAAGGWLDGGDWAGVVTRAVRSRKAEFVASLTEGGTGWEEKDKERGYRVVEEVLYGMADCRRDGRDACVKALLAMSQAACDEARSQALKRAVAGALGVLVQALSVEQASLLRSSLSQAARSIAALAEEMKERHGVLESLVPAGRERGAPLNMQLQRIKVHRFVDEEFGSQRDDEVDEEEASGIVGGEEKDDDDAEEGVVSLEEIEADGLAESYSNEAAQEDKQEEMAPDGEDKTCRDPEGPDYCEEQQHLEGEMKKTAEGENGVVVDVEAKKRQQVKVAWWAGMPVRKSSSEGSNDDEEWSSDEDECAEGKAEGKVLVSDTSNCRQGLEQAGQQPQSDNEPESPPQSDNEPESPPQSDNQPKSPPQSDNQPKSPPQSDNEPQPAPQDSGTPETLETDSSNKSRSLEQWTPFHGNHSNEAVTEETVDGDEGKRDVCCWRKMPAQKDSSSGVCEEFIVYPPVLSRPSYIASVGKGDGVDTAKQMSQASTASDNGSAPPSETEESASSSRESQPKSLTLETEDGHEYNSPHSLNVDDSSKDADDSNSPHSLNVDDSSKDADDSNSPHSHDGIAGVSFAPNVNLPIEHMPSRGGDATGSPLSVAGGDAKGSPLSVAGGDAKGSPLSVAGIPVHDLTEASSDDGGEESAELRMERGIGDSDRGEQEQGVRHTSCWYADMEDVQRFLQNASYFVHRHESLQRLSEAKHNEDEVAHQIDDLLAMGFEEIAAADFRLAWLRILARFHTKNDRIAEAAACVVEQAREIEKFLGPSPQQGDAGWQQSVREAFVHTRKVAGGWHGEDPFSCKELIRCYRESAGLLLRAGDHAGAHKTQMRYLDLASKVDDWEVLEDGHIMAMRIAQEARKGRGPMREFFRVRMFGKRFGARDGGDFIYAADACTRIGDFREQLCGQLALWIEERERREEQRARVKAVTIEIVPNTVDASGLNPDPDTCYLQVSSIHPGEGPTTEGSEEALKSHLLGGGFVDAKLWDRSMSDSLVSDACSKFHIDLPLTEDGEFGRAKGAMGCGRQRTVLSVKHTFPFRTRRQRVSHVTQQVLSPQEAAAEDLLGRAQAIVAAREVYRTGMESGGEGELLRLLMGSLLVQVNDGPFGLLEAFSERSCSASSCSNEHDAAGRRFVLAFQLFLGACNKGLEGLIVSDMALVGACHEMNFNYSKLCDVARTHGIDPSGLGGVLLQNGIANPSQVH